MLEWMILPFKRYFDFSGRSRRKEFWGFVLLNLIVYAVLSAIVFGTGLSMSDLANADPSNPLAVYGVLFSGTGLLLVAWWLVTIIPTIAVSVRRFHDRDMSGWWYLGVFIGSMIPFIGFIVSIAFLVLMCLEGTRGPNRFGPDPKDPVGAAVFS